jgi:hypothetical protein
VLLGGIQVVPFVEDTGQAKMRFVDNLQRLDGREALVGVLTPPDSCQAVVSSNAALLDALQGYFVSRRAPGSALPEVSVRSSTSRG